MTPRDVDDLLSTAAYPDLAPNLAMHVAGRTALRELRPGDWERFAKSAGLAPPFVRRRVRALAALAVERAEGTAGQLAASGLDRDALRAFAARVAGRARRLARTA